MYGYSYPISFSEIIDADEGNCKVEVTTSGMNSNMTNTHVVLTPIIQIN